MNLLEALTKLRQPDRAKFLEGYFATGKGGYSKDDRFLGLRVPQVRAIAKKHYTSVTSQELHETLKSQYHEARLCALVVLCLQYNKAKDDQRRTEIYNYYLANTDSVNNWDLVDASAHKIVGPHLLNRDRTPLYRLARSKDLWERRIAMVSTFAFIRNNEFEDTIKIAEILLNDDHHLINKAVGWMLREMGKRHSDQLLKFLDTHHKTMPRVTLRYAIEHLTPSLRTHYLTKN